MRYLAFPIIWMGVIFIFSTDLGADRVTHGYLSQFIRLLFPEMDQAGIDDIIFAIRKISHVTEYAILSILWCAALRGRFNLSSEWALLAAIVFSALYAGVDEWHQAAVPSRTSSLQDVGIDTAGALIGQALWGGRLSWHTAPTRTGQSFGWWFAWGAFSALLLLIVVRGGGLTPTSLFLATMAVASVAGMVGMVYHVRRR